MSRSIQKSILALLPLLLVRALRVARRADGMNQPTGDFDRDYLVETLDHLTHDLKIARACPGKHIRPELQSFCSDLKVQTQEHDQMAEWLKSWYQKQPPNDPIPLWLESQDGETFERYFLKGVLDGHREVAERAAGCIKQAKHSELASQEVSSHRAEEARKVELRMV